jgi:hypothetical protein
MRRARRRCVRSGLGFASKAARVCKPLFPELCDVHFDNTVPLYSLYATKYELKGLAEHEPVGRESGSRVGMP